MTRADLPARRARVRAASTRFLMGADAVPVGDQLRALAATAESVPDVYGAGGDVAALEAEVAELLGKPAAVFMPSDTMAQQCALRVWAERTGRGAVAVHGLSHLVQHEEGALEALHHLRVDQLIVPSSAHGRRPGDGDRPVRRPVRRAATARRAIPAPDLGRAVGAVRSGARKRCAGAPRRSAAVGEPTLLRPHARRDRRAGRHRVRLVLQGAARCSRCTRSRRAPARV